MENSKKILYLRKLNMSNEMVKNIWLYPNVLIGMMIFCILTFFTDLPFEDIIFYNQLIVIILIVQLLTSVIRSLLYLRVYKIRKSYIRLRFIHYIKNIFSAGVLTISKFILGVFIVYLWMPVGIIFDLIIKTYFKFGIIFFQFDNAQGLFSPSPMETGIPLNSIKGVFFTYFMLEFLVVFYGALITLCLYYTFKGK